MFYLYHLHLIQSVDSILVYSGNVPFSVTSGNNVIDSVTPILSSSSMIFQKSAYTHKVECILNMNYRFQSWTLIISEVMRLFSMHITQLWIWLRKLIFRSSIASKTSVLKKNTAWVLYIHRHMACGVKHEYWNHLLCTVFVLFIDIFAIWGKKRQNAHNLPYNRWLNEL